MRTRHEIYNRQLALCEKLEKAGRAVIIRPLKPLNVSRTKAEVPRCSPYMTRDFMRGARHSVQLKKCLVLNSNKNKGGIFMTLFKMENRRNFGFSAENPTGTKGGGHTRQGL